MPKRTDISYILVSGRACAFDYAALQAVKAPKG